MFNKKTLMLTLKFFLPLGLWIFLFRLFLFGRTLIITENYMFYSILKYYLDNLRLGVVPLWDPYSSWGVLNTFLLTHISLFNPLWIATLLLNFLGVSFYQAYIYSLAIYFFMGLWGFYQLAQVVLRNRMAAYSAFLLLTFSSLSIPLPAQAILLFIFVPSVWFFFFLFMFVQSWQKRFFVGALFSLMIIASTYLPFYFLTVFLLVILLGIILYPRKIYYVIRGFLKFFKKHCIWGILSLVFLSLSLMPAVTCYQSALNKEVVSPERHDGRPTALTNGVTLPGYFSGGALTARMSFDDLYSHLNQIHYGSDGFFYVSMFAFIILLFGIFNKNDRQVIYLAFLTVGILLLIFSNAACLHRFLFDHVFYFRLFRNLHYLLPFLLSSFILFVCYQLKIFLETMTAQDRFSWPACILVFFVHFGLALFLLFKDSIIISSFLTLALSLVFFVYLLIRRGKANRPLLWGMVLLCVTVQPFEVFWHYNNQKSPFFDSKDIQQGVRLGPRRPKFSYTREEIFPDPSDEQAYSIFFHSFRLRMKDDPGFIVPTKAFPSFWSYTLAQNVPAEVFRPYVEHKFYIYDRVEVANPKTDFGKITRALKDKTNTAFVHLSDLDDFDDVKTLSERFFKGISSQAETIPGPSGEFEVMGFDANTIKIRTNFPEEKFLVYTDSFHSHWQGFINGTRAIIYRTNLAFKGIRLPAGKNIVLLRFHPPGGIWIYHLTYLAFVVLFIYLVISFLPLARTKKISGWGKP